MNTTGTTAIELLKSILAHLRDPEQLDDHPWSDSMHGSGERLVEMTTATFRRMTPPGPPRYGKRLDTRWGAFGILAAQYFAPLALGEPFPSSLREAWNGLDRAILYFVYGDVEGMSEDEMARYRLAGNEIEPAPNSTLSDWHRKGLEELANLVEHEQKRLKETPRPGSPWPIILKRAGLALGLFLLVLGMFLGWKGWTFVQRIRDIEQKINTLEPYLDSRPKLDQVPEIAEKVHGLRVEMDSLQAEAEPYLWMGPYLAWVPKYGGTISQAGELIKLAQNLSIAADDGLTAISPTIETTLNGNQPLEVMDLVLRLQNVSPQLLSAQVSLAQAQEARSKIDVGSLIPRIGSVILKHIDPLFASIANSFPMEDALTMVRLAPTLLGGGKIGPQTYLILIQNEDELRPTGGFITAVGSAVVKDGKLISIKFDPSEFIDDFSKPYPVSPWQFKEFMNIEMLIFRDSNWFTDFPTTASWAEYYYSYSRSSSADGVVAIDMQVIKRLLKTMGPVRVDNVSFPITSENVEDYMRAAKESPPKGVRSDEWDRKQFIGKLAQPILENILNARGETWARLGSVMMELLDEKHILLQFDNEEATAFLERRNWDGAVRIPKVGDFLMVVDTNMGYNKSNAVMEMALDYAVDLTNLAHPAGLLAVQQINHSTVEALCEPRYTSRYLKPILAPGEIPDQIYNMDECHWGYLRIYTPSGTKLTRSNPQEIPAESTMLGETIPARTDDLGDEEIPGAQVFGMLVLTPTRETTTATFEYALPMGVLSQSTKDESWSYGLKIQKQPGMVAQPFHLSLHLPTGIRIKNASIPFTENAGVWTATFDLRRDLLIDVTFGK